MRSIIKTRILVFSTITIFACLSAALTSYSYGRWFNHDRYWHGTIARVEVGQTRLIRSLLTQSSLTVREKLDATAWKLMFAPIDGRLILEIREGDTVIYSNFNRRFERRALLDVFDLPSGQTVSISRYEPPSWNRNFGRWLRYPDRWLEPSFDHITMPFFWFLVIYLLVFFSFGLIIKSTYLERDVLRLLRDASQRFGR